MSSLAFACGSGFEHLLKELSTPRGSGRPPGRPRIPPNTQGPDVGTSKSSCSW